MSGRMRFIDAEPCSIGADTVVRLLERIGWTSAAGLIRRLDERDSQQTREADRWRQAYYEIKERYEPSKPREAPPDFRPPPEASD